MNTKLTYYCVASIFTNVGVISHVSSTLDQYIKNNQFDRAQGFIKTLGLTKEHEKQLSVCVNSYIGFC